MGWSTRPNIDYIVSASHNKQNQNEWLFSYMYSEYLKS